MMTRVGALGLLIAPVITLLWWPQFGDQALFQLGGSALADGSIYWRDFWDLKQPGVFWLYQLSEQVGAGVLGVRVIEIIAVLVAGHVVFRLATEWTPAPWLRMVAPLLVLGPYVLSGDGNGVGQVEGLLTLPMVLLYSAVRWALTSTERRAVVGWAALAGLAVAVTLTMKVLYLPLCLVVAVAAAAGVRRAHRTPAAVVPAAVGFLVGALVPVGAALAWFAYQGVLPLAWYSTVRAPLDAAATGLLTKADVVVAGRALVLATALTAPLAVVAVATAWRRRTVARDVWLGVWAVTALLLMAPQLPTAYRILLVLPPVGMLAVIGLDVTARWLAERGTVTRSVVTRSVVAVVVVVLALPLVIGPGRLVLELVRGGPATWALDDSTRLAVGDRLSGSPAPGAEMADVIPPGTAIYVFGDPRMYRVLDARQAVEINGWSPEIMSPAVWRELTRELDRSRPEWVFVGDAALPYVEAGSADLVTLFAQAYRPERTTVTGTWLRTAAPGSPAPSPEGNQLGRDP